MELPVYLVTGFLEGGKTSFMKEILKDKDFLNDDDCLLIVCEEGIEEFDTKYLDSINTTLIMVEDEEELTHEFLKDCEKKYNPGKIFIEYNGMWDLDRLYDEIMPENWAIVQVMTPIDSSTFSSYMGNMGSIMVEQFRDSDLVIFNRCNKETKKLALRGSVKAVNKQARVIFELEDGSIDDSEAELPFDINAEIIEPEDYDFGLLFEDLMSSPAKYEGKKLKLKLMAYDPDKYPPQFCVLGRNAMTCCADDITPLGLICRFENDVVLEDGEYVEVVATVHQRNIKDYEEELPVLYVEKIKSIEKLEDELVYFY